MTSMLREFKYKWPIIFITICAVSGGIISYFSKLSFLTATLIIAIALLVNGLAMYTEDLEPGGLDYQSGVTDTPEARKAQKKAQRIHGAIILILFVALLWSVI